MMFMDKHLKKIVIGLIALSALLAGALIYREIDARRIPPLALESPTTLPAETDMPMLTTRPTSAEVQDVPTATPTLTHTPVATPTSAASPLPDPATDTAAESTTAPSIPKPVPGAYGTITIRGKAFTLKRGVDEKTLTKDIGWMDSSTPPGSEGVCVVMGHRNTQFRILKDVEKGDTVTIVDSTGATYSYTVQSARIIEKDSDLRFTANEGKTLTLVTCYPFYYQGHAPFKYIVTAKMSAS